MTWQIVLFMGLATIVFLAVVLASIQNNKQIKKEKELKKLFS